MPLKKSPTQLVVGGIIAAALIAVAFLTAGLWGGLALSAVAAYEAWTLVNKYPNDTISEIIWELNSRPLIPFMGGAALSWAIASGTVTDPWLIVSFGFIAGHFWFQRKGD